MRAKPLRHVALFGLAASALLLAASGCCGGYAVVSTTVHEHAVVGASGELTAGAATVLHYGRLGEPPNACGSGAKYVEDLWIQVPSTQAGATYVLGTPGVVAAYLRDQDGNPVRATSVSGTLRIKETTTSGLMVVLDLTIRLPSGEAARLDDEYAFHPRSAPEQR
jgi:hypothetical protein